MRQEQREKKFGDFDDHLEDVTIGGCLSFMSDVRVGWGIVLVVVARVVEVDACGVLSELRRASEGLACGRCSR